MDVGRYISLSQIGLYNQLKSIFLGPGDYVEQIGAISRLLHSPDVYSHVQSVGGFGQHGERERGRGSEAVWIWQRAPNEYPDASSWTLVVGGGLSLL